MSRSGWLIGHLGVAMVKSEARRAIVKLEEDEKIGGGTTSESWRKADLSFVDIRREGGIWDKG